jgi:hypothetical protein
MFQPLQGHLQVALSILLALHPLLSAIMKLMVEGISIKPYSIILSFYYQNIDKPYLRILQSVFYIFKDKL